MLINLPILEDDILEVASFACDFENQIPTASKALLDNCTSMLASKLQTADDFAQFAREASKDPRIAPLAIKLLAGISNCAKSSPHPEVDISQESHPEADQGVFCDGDKVKDYVSCVETLKSSEEELECSNCKLLTWKWLIGEELVEEQKKTREILFSWEKFVADYKDERNLESVSLEEKTEVCPNCKVKWNMCLGGHEVRFIQPQQVFIFNNIYLRALFSN